MLWNDVEQICGQNMDEIHSFVYTPWSCTSIQFVFENPTDAKIHHLPLSTCSISIRAEAAASVSRKAITDVTANP